MGKAPNSPNEGTLGAENPPITAWTGQLLEIFRSEQRRFESAVTQGSDLAELYSTSSSCNEGQFFQGEPGAKKMPFIHLHQMYLVRPISEGELFGTPRFFQDSIGS